MNQERDTVEIRNVGLPLAFSKPNLYIKSLISGLATLGTLILINTIFSVRVDFNVVVLSVTDNGLGIDLVLHKDQIFKIRKTFHKHPDAKGFGLFMTKTQVEAMNGKIWADSQPEKGSTFFIEFKNQNV